VEYARGRITVDDRAIEVVDLPGLYSLRAATSEERVARDVIVGDRKGVPKADAVVVVADADNIERSLFLVSQMLDYGEKIIVALNMIDVADRHGIHVDVEKLSRELGCPVIPTVARTGRGIQELKIAIADLLERKAPIRIRVADQAPTCETCGGCPYQARYNWSEGITSRCVQTPRVASERRTEKIDRVVTQPVIGVLGFFAVMLGVFYLIFSVATIPMDLIDGLFARAGDIVGRVVPEGNLQSLLIDGIIGGVGGILVFLPQICILFFFLALLEDSGYLARAAFVMDRLMRRIGLPGTAFVPLLSAHACAIPAIMATRVIRDPRDRLLTILVAPLMTCSARIPVYAMVTALLFPSNPLMAALVFTGAYGLGVVAALAMAFIFRRTILPGEARPLVLELPSYKLPSLRTALLQTLDRGMVFVKQAGTIILMISVILWGLATFPQSEPPAAAVAMTQQAQTLLAEGGSEAEARALTVEAERLADQHSLVNSFAGRLGKLIEPVVAPLGFDWQIGIGVISSFAAREVIVSTMAVVYGLGGDGGDDQAGLYNTLRRAQRADGTAVFTVATSLSLLIFYVLAMQCLPTQAVTRRETGTWKWPVFQLAYMTVLAYGAALVTFQGLRLFGIS
jgi:ferrous iron transport protein B